MKTSTIQKAKQPKLQAVPSHGAVSNCIFNPLEDLSQLKGMINTLNILLVNRDEKFMVSLDEDDLAGCFQILSSRAEQIYEDFKNAIEEMDERNAVFLKARGARGSDRQSID